MWPNWIEKERRLFCLKRLIEERDERLIEERELEWIFEKEKIIAKGGGGGEEHR